MPTVQEITKLLDERGISYRLMEHEPVRTSAEAARVRGVELHTGAKALVVETEKGLHLAVLPADERLDWRKLRHALGADRVSLASRDEVEAVTGLQVGAIPPFGNLLDLETIFDNAVLANEVVRFNAASRSHSIEMRSEDLAAIVKPSVASITAPAAA